MAKFQPKLKNLVFLLILISLSISYKEETEESKRKRFGFLKKYEKEVVINENISFEFDDSNGTYCKVQKDIFQLEFTIAVKKDYLICESKSLYIID